MMRQKLAIFLLISSSLLLHANEKSSEVTPYRFHEVWAYVMQSEEKWVCKTKPITDLAYFSAHVNGIGRISDAPNPRLLREAISSQTRLHCVISAPDNSLLMSWCLKKDLDTRNALINDIVHISHNYDGIQIDFESIHPDDGAAFLSFLKEIKKNLSKEKIVSIALPARFKEASDAYPYKKISEIVDKVLIMAYDEHWRTGPPGTIASLDWCKKVCAYAKDVIPSNKLVMGIPLYGRVWQKQEVARPLKYFETLDLWKQHSSTVQRHADGSPYFEYKETVDAIVHFEDLQSLKTKLNHYQSANIPAVGFWRLSQEPAALWQHIETVSAQ